MSLENIGSEQILFRFKRFPHPFYERYTSQNASIGRNNVTAFGQGVSAYPIAECSYNNSGDKHIS